LTCSDYIQSAKVWYDQLAAVGKPIPDEYLISFLLNGLNPSYNTFVTTISLLTREKQLSLDDFSEELINHETLLNQQQASPADISTFALFTKKQGQKSFRGRGQYPAKFPTRNFSSRPPFPAVRFSNNNSSAAPRYNTSTRYNNSYAPRYSSNSPLAQRNNSSAGLLPLPGSG
jgi:hypothetical protein